MTTPTRQDSIVAACLIAAVVGLTPFTNPGCAKTLTIQDPQTGQLRPITQEELDKLITDTGNIVKVITITTGHPEAVPFIDLGARLAAILVAFFYGRPKTTSTKPGGNNQ